MDVKSTPSGRRSILRGAGIAGLAGIGAVAGLAAAQPAHAQDVDKPEQQRGGPWQQQPGLPILRPEDDWAAVLASTPQVQLVPGAVYPLTQTVNLPANTLIEGNGAVVTVASDGIGAFAATQVNGVSLNGIIFRGRADDPINTAPEFAHVAVRVDRVTDLSITGCRFTHWRGAGVVVTGSRSDDYFSYRTHVSGNSFNRCYFGISLADRSEYGEVSGNTFTANRLAIWHTSGNWTINGNVVVNCYGAYYSIAATSPYGQLASDNWNHGSVTGNTFNHANGAGGQRWTTGAAFPVGGNSTDPGPGVVIDGLLPPTFTANTLWYTNIRANNNVGTAWLLTGCTLSNLNISCTGNNWIHLLGFQSNGAGNKPKLSGNVRDLLPV